MIFARMSQQLGVENLRNSITTLVPRYFASAGTMFFTLGCQLIWFVILARSLGVSQFGELMIITGVNTMAATFCTMGSRETIVRRTSRDTGDYAQMLGQGLLLICTLGTVLVILSVLFLKLFVSNTSTSVSVTSLGLFAITQIMFFPFVGLATAAFMGFQNFRVANIMTASASLLRLLAASIAFLVFNITSLAEWAVWTASANLSLALAFSLILRRLGPPVWRIDAKELARGFHFSTPLFIYALRFNIDRIVLGLVVSASVLGAYAVAMRMTLMGNTVVGSLNRIIYPALSKRMHGGIAGSFRLAIAYTVLVTGLSTATACGIYLIAPYLPVLLGEEYREVVFDLRVLCWLVIPLAITAVPFDTLGAMDQHALRSNYHNKISIFGAVGSALTIYFFGITGAFVSFYIVEIALAAGMWAAFLYAADYRERGVALSPPQTQTIERAFSFIISTFSKAKKGT